MWRSQSISDCRELVATPALSAAERAEASGALDSFCSLRAPHPQAPLHLQRVATSAGLLGKHWVGTHLRALRYCVSLTLAFSLGFFLSQSSVAVFHATSVSGQRSRDGLKRLQVRPLCLVPLLLQCTFLNLNFGASWTMASLTPEVFSLSRPRSRVGGMAPAC